VGILTEMLNKSMQDNLRIIEGFSELLATNGEILEGEEWTARVAWRRHFRKAWLIKMRDKMFVTWKTMSAPPDIKESNTVILIWAMGLANYTAEPQPTGKFTIELNEQEIISFCFTRRSRCWVRNDCRFYYETKRRDIHSSYGLGYLLVPGRLIKQNEQQIIRILGSNSCSDQCFIVCEYGENNLATGISFSEPNATATFYEHGISAIIKGPERPTRDGLHLYWGDLHVHSNMANYVQATPEENYEYARFVSQLDFIAITDQDHFLSDKMFETVIQNANRNNIPGKFVAFIGYEWSSRLYGHRNVIFGGDKGILIRRHNIDTPYRPPYPQENRDSFYALCKGLKHYGEPCLLIPHHPSITSMGPLNWSIFDPELECVVEIYSLWGSSECNDVLGRSLASDQRSGSYVQDALAKGLRLGIIASGEVGDGHPGNTQWRREYARKNGFPLTPLGGGLAAVWAKDLTRESIFKAIKSRRCYGTTNARIILEFKINGHWMGEIIPVAKNAAKSSFNVNITVTVNGSERIEGIYVIQNGNIIHYTPGYADTMSIEYRHNLQSSTFIQVGERLFTYYYVKILQKDGHMAWSSPIWIWVEN